MTAGTLQRLEAGDRACYVDLLDEQGNTFHELADFEICSQESMLGKKVRLFYEQANVLAATCERDMDCGRTDRVVLIRRVELLRSGSQPSAPSAVATPCLAEERIVFSCETTKNKVVSLCSSDPLTENTAYLQYRFGTVGQNPDLSFPPTHTTSIP